MYEYSEITVKAVILSLSSQSVLFEMCSWYKRSHRLDQQSSCV